MTLVALTPSEGLASMPGAAATSMITAESVDETLAAGPSCVLLSAGSEWQSLAADLRDRRPSLPILLTGDLTRDDLVEASRLGIEAAPDDVLAARGEQLADRVQATTHRPTRSAETDRWHAGALSGLLDTSRELLRARDRDRVADIVTNAATDVLGVPYAVLRFYNPETDRLVPASETDAVAREMPDREPYDVGDSAVGTAFESGEIVEVTEGHPVYSDLPPGVESSIAIPLGEYGTLSVAVPETDSFGADRRALASVLAATTKAALDRTWNETQLELYHAAHESVEEAVCVIDDDGIVRLATDPLLDAIGRDRGNTVGTPVETYLSPDAVETSEQLTRELDAAPPGASRTFETTLNFADRGVTPVEIELSMLPDDARITGVVAVIRDRSELQAERQRFASLFEQTPDPVADVVLTDDGPRVRRVNNAFEHVFGLDSTQLEEEWLDEYIVPTDAEVSATTLNERALDEPDGVEIERVAADGRRTFLFRGVQYGETADGPLVFGTYTDITDRRNDERRIRVMNRIFRHDLANSNGIVRGYLELLSERLEGEPATFVDNALEATERVTDIAETVRDIERALNGADTAATSSLRDLVEGSVADARETYPDATFTVTTPAVDVPGGKLLARAISELIENAATHAGDAPNVIVAGSVTDTEATIRVTDDGPGVPELERAVVMGEVEITQLDHSRGLGLWLVTYVSRSLGGRIDFEDDGRTVTLTLPRADVE